MRLAIAAWIVACEFIVRLLLGRPGRRSAPIDGRCAAILLVLGSVGRAPANGLHLPESMRVRIAHREELLALLEPDPQTTAHVARQAGDRVHVDERAAMDLPERARIELVDELSYRAPDQRFLLRGHDARVLVVGLEVADLLDCHQPQ